MDVWALDEVHFQQYGSRCRLWVPPEEKTPILRHHPGRESVGYFGAVRLRDGKLLYRQEPKAFNGATCARFFRQLRGASRRAGRTVAVIIDNVQYHHARLHRAWREAQLPDFVLHYLPPYSPELNPIERVWKLVRKLRLHNQYFPTLEHVITEVEDLFDGWRDGNETLRKLCAFT